MVRLEAPWQTYQKKIKALFERDKDIIVGEIYEATDGGVDYAFDIEVMRHDKYIALDRVLTGVKVFGNVTLGIVLYDEENASNADPLSLYKTLFDGNPIVKAIATRTDATGTDWNYICFNPEIVQFFDDDLTDFNGNWSGLAEDIAREVFADNYHSVNFCTAAKDGVDKPLGEWP